MRSSISCLVGSQFFKRLLPVGFRLVSIRLLLNGVTRVLRLGLIVLLWNGMNVNSHLVLTALLRNGVAVIHHPVLNVLHLDGVDGILPLMRGPAQGGQLSPMIAGDYLVIWERAGVPKWSKNWKKRNL